MEQRATIHLLVMISRFRLRDFKGHRDTQLELGRFTMLVGDNASGKTSVLDALALVSAFADGPLNSDNAYRMLYADLLRRSGPNSIVLDAAGTRASLGWEISIDISIIPAERPTDYHSCFEAKLTGRLGDSELMASAERRTDGSGRQDSHWSDLIRQTLGIANLYRLNAEKIAVAAPNNRPELRIEADGTNTTSVLASMKLHDDERFERVENQLRKLIPSIERVRLRPATVIPQSGTLSEWSKLYFNFRGASKVPAQGASNGTLIVVALLTVLNDPNRPNVILMDDLDQALHPRAQMELVRMIKNLLSLDEFNDLQIVATTHSPYVLDEFEPTDVYAFALRDDGTVASKRLSEHPEAERTRGTLKAGQLWSLDPERDWVLKG